MKKTKRAVAVFPKNRPTYFFQASRFRQTPDKAQRAWLFSRAFRFHEMSMHAWLDDLLLRSNLCGAGVVRELRVHCPLLVDVIYILFNDGEAHSWFLLRNMTVTIGSFIFRIGIFLNDSLPLIPLPLPLLLIFRLLLPMMMSHIVANFQLLPDSRKRCMMLLFTFLSVSFSSIPCVVTSAQLGRISSRGTRANQCN